MLCCRKLVWRVDHASATLPATMPMPPSSSSRR